MKRQAADEVPRGRVRFLPFDRLVGRDRARLLDFLRDRQAKFDWLLAREFCL